MDCMAAMLHDALIEAGLRPAEVAALRWGDVDWLRGRLNVAVRLLPGPEPVFGNTERPRAVGADWDLLAGLEAHRALLVSARAGDGSARFVFPDLEEDPHGGLPLSGSEV